MERKLKFRCLGEQFDKFEDALRKSETQVNPAPIYLGTLCTDGKQEAFYVQRVIQQAYIDWPVLKDVQL